MKKHIVKIFAVILLTTVAVSSCSLQYRQHRREAHSGDRDHNHDDHHYNRTNN